jgi:hypothetical protein
MLFLLHRTKKIAPAMGPDSVPRPPTKAMGKASKVQIGPKAAPGQ